MWFETVLTVKLTVKAVNLTVIIVKYDMIFFYLFITWWPENRHVLRDLHSLSFRLEICNGSIWSLRGMEANSNSRYN